MAQETDLNNLEGTLPAPAASSGGLSGLNTVLRAALNEATQSQVKSRIEATQPLLEGGAAPSVIRSAIGLAQAGLKESRDSIFSDTINVYNKDVERANARRQSTLNNINTMIDNDVFADTPDEVLLSMEKEAGLPAGTILSYKAQNKANKKLDDITRAKQDRLLDLQIQEKLNDIGGGNETLSNNPIKELQNAVNAGFTPLDAALDVARHYESFGIQVDKKTLDNWKRQAEKMKKETATAPIVQPQVAPSKPAAASAGKKIKETSAYLQTLGGHPEIIGGTIVESAKNIGSFFSGLFGN